MTAALSVVLLCQCGDDESGSPRGTGLGLTISQRIVEHHGGEIWCRSTRGEGTTFSFRLPAERTAAPAGPPAPLVDSPASLVTK